MPGRTVTVRPGDRKAATQPTVVTALVTIRSWNGEITFQEEKAIDTTPFIGIVLRPDLTLMSWVKVRGCVCLIQQVRAVSPKWQSR